MSKRKLDVDDRRGGEKKQRAVKKKEKKKKSKMKTLTSFSLVVISSAGRKGYVFSQEKTCRP
jgi:hypothetical protein